MDPIELKELGYTILSEYIKTEKNLLIINNIIYNNSDDECMYKNMIFQTWNELHNGVKIKDLNILKEKYDWTHSIYEHYAKIMEEQNSFIEKPFEVEEGVVTCKSCNSNKVFTFSKQVRSADEPMTTFATCANCSKRWSYSG